MASQTNFAGAGASLAGAGTPWSNPGNATGAPDAVTADASFASLTTTNVLELTSYGFTVPFNALITGFVVVIRRKGTGGATFTVDSSLKLVIPSTSGTPAERGDGATHWPTSLGDATYGSSSDLWGYTQPILITNIDHNALGIDFKAVNSLTAAASASVDSASIQVFYTVDGLLMPPVTVISKVHSRHYKDRD